MTSRREFLAQSSVASGILTMSGTQLAVATEKGATSASAPNDAALASKPLRILILGGTGWIGPHFVRAAVMRGHRVSVFNRGKNNAVLPPSVEPLIGDRNGDLESIKNREWDAVLDLAAFMPIWVRTVGQALSGRVKHYTFISTEAVYQYPGATDENSKVLEYTETADPYSLTVPNTTNQQYGSLKLLCEREAERQFPGQALILRPGAIVGPGDPVGAFAYWLVRMGRGGEILVAGEPLSQVQIIDVRDLAEWAIRMAENTETGVFNAIGPAMFLAWGEMLGGMRGTFSVPLRLTWVPAPWLIEQKVAMDSNLLYWPSEAGYPGLFSMSHVKALSKGLTFRSLAVTVADTLAWYDAQPPQSRGKWIRGFDGNSSVEDSIAREQQLLVAWHAHQKTIS